VKSDLVRQLKGDEGIKPFAYQDSEGFWTIGVGRLVDKRKPGSGLRPDEIAYLLNNDIDDRINALGSALSPWFQDLDDARKGVLLNMAFQLGLTGLLKFSETLDLVRRGRYAEASSEMLNSLWAHQTPNRANRLAKQMLTGEWQFAPGA
jgi:lysozyme